MIALWMLATVLATALLALAAVAAERGCRALRVSARFAWLAAMLVAGAVAVSPAVARQSLARNGGDATYQSAESVVPIPEASLGATELGAEARLATGVQDRAIETLGVLDRPLALLWGAGSLAYALLLLAGWLAVARARSRWRQTELDGVPVLVSHDLGPAVIGTALHSIVVPTWVLALSPQDRRLVLAHEREHATRGDPVLLAVARLIVLALPWNLPLWSMLRRLDLAIEIDCDSRVIQGTHDARRYGHLLLDVAARSVGGVVPLAAMAARPSALQHRLAQVAGRNRPRARGWGALWLGTAALVLLAAAVLPRPRAAAVRSAATLAFGEQVRDHEERSVAESRAASVADSLQVRRRIADQLFRGIHLSPGQHRAAERAIAETQRAQAALLPIGSREEYWRLVALQRTRDSLLLSLLVDSADRVRFQRQAAEMSPRSRIW